MSTNTLKTFEHLKEIGCWDVSLAPRSQAFSPRSGCRRPGSLGPRECICPQNPQDSQIPDPGCEFLTQRATEGGKVTSSATGKNSEQRTQRCDQTFTSTFYAVIITMCVPWCAHTDSHMRSHTQ